VPILDCLKQELRKILSYETCATIYQSERRNVIGELRLCRVFVVTSILRQKFKLSLFPPLECQYIYFAVQNGNSVREMSHVLENL